MEVPIILKALKELDKILDTQVELLIGGGSALLMAHHIPLSTADIDGLILSSKLTAAELDPKIKAVGQKLNLGAHWYNDYFSTFIYTIPQDFKSRLKTVYEGQKLKVLALGKEDLLIMKCFSAREKDLGHVKAIVRQGVSIDIVEKQIEALIAKKLPGAERAKRFLYEVLDELEVS